MSASGDLIPNMMSEDPALIAAEEEAQVPAPALLLCWKHHAAVISARIGQVVADGEQALRALPQRLLSIGGSQMDLYVGQLAPDQITSELIELLRQREVFEPQVYKVWLEDQGGYAALAVSDRSGWVLRWGRTPGRYLHIHPARYAPLTVRARATSLKTAIVALAWAGVYGGDPSDVSVVNQARQALLALSALRSLSREEGVGALIALLQRG